MICTGTGSAPMRAFTMARQRRVGPKEGGMVMFFGARTPQSLPYFGPLNKLPESLMQKHLCYSRVAEGQREYVQDRMLQAQGLVAEMLQDGHTHVYVCGLKEMEAGVDTAFEVISQSFGANWPDLRDSMRDAGRYHVETY
jgi:benzoyl-CoA 2,3-dioxygenase component A